jgi:uncharacterized protein YigA (DUF484 family)
MMKHEHKPLIDALSKMMQKGSANDQIFWHWYYEWIKQLSKEALTEHLMRFFMNMPVFWQLKHAFQHEALWSERK